MAALLGVVQMLVWATTYYLPAIVNGPVAADLGLSRAWVLGAFSWALLVSGLASPHVGRWVDRTGGRVVLATGCIVQAVGLGLLALTGSLVWWYAVWTLLGIGMAMGLYDAAFATVGRQLGAAARPAIVGITLLGGFASSVGWPLGTWLFATLGWRETAAIYAMVQLVVNLPLVLLAVPAGAPRPHPVPPRAQGAGPIRARRNLLLVAIFFTLRAFIAGMVTVHALLLLKGLGLGEHAAVAAAALIGPGQVAARLLETAFSRLLTPLATAWAGALLLPLGALAPTLGAPGIAFTLAYGMSNGVLTISRGTLPLYLLGPAGYARIIGRIALPVMLAQAVAPTVTAPLIARYPAADLFLAMAILAALASLCLAPLRPDSQSGSGVAK
jgi:MFS family permease